MMEPGLTKGVLKSARSDVVTNVLHAGNSDLVGLSFLILIM